MFFSAETVEHALAYIAQGHDAAGLVHLLRHPEGGDYGVSTPLEPGANLAGLTERYYTLAEIAGTV